ncbi:MAG: hypothetical protein ABIB71_00090 [Candidatus Woesearchaeota archaeon]
MKIMKYTLVALLGLGLGCCPKKGVRSPHCPPRYSVESIATENGLTAKKIKETYSTAGEMYTSEVMVLTHISEANVCLDSLWIDLKSEDQWYPKIAKTLESGNPSYVELEDFGCDGMVDEITTGNDKEYFTCDNCHKDLLKEANKRLKKAKKYLALPKSI